MGKQHAHNRSFSRPLFACYIPCLSLAHPLLLIVSRPPPINFSHTRTRMWKETRQQRCRGDRSAASGPTQFIHISHPRMPDQTNTQTMGQREAQNTREENTRSTHHVGPDYNSRKAQHKLNTRKASSVALAPTLPLRPIRTERSRGD